MGEECSMGTAQPLLQRSCIDFSTSEFCQGQEWQVYSVRSTEQDCHAKGSRGHNRRLEEEEKNEHSVRGNTSQRLENVSLRGFDCSQFPVSLWLLLSATGTQSAYGSFQHQLSNLALDIENNQ